MNKENAHRILSEYLGPDYFVMECYDKLDDILLFSVKPMKYKDDNFVLPDGYGVDSSGKVLNWKDITKILHEKGIS